MRSNKTAIARREPGDENNDEIQELSSSQYSTAGSRPLLSTIVYEEEREDEQQPNSLSSISSVKDTSRLHVATFKVCSASLR